jgi:histone-lysine N-methyltransferase SETMAR
VADEFDDLKLNRVPHPPYSPDLSLCDFWLFGMLKHQIKDRTFRATEEILNAIRDLWNEVTSDQLHSVFFNWMRRLEYVIEHEGEYYIN